MLETAVTRIELTKKTQQGISIQQDNNNNKISLIWNWKNISYRGEALVLLPRQLSRGLQDPLVVGLVLVVHRNGSLKKKHFWIWTLGSFMREIAEKERNSRSMTMTLGPPNSEQQQKRVSSSLLSRLFTPYLCVWGRDLDWGQQKMYEIRQLC